MKDMFPILGWKPIQYVPLDVVKPHEKQAIINHGQTLERLAQRGGLGWIEMLYVLKDECYDYKAKISEMDAKAKVMEIVNSQQGGTFTLVCNKCGAKSIIKLKEELFLEDEEMKNYLREIVQEGDVRIIVSHGFEEISIKCNNCGLEIDDTTRREYK